MAYFQQIDDLLNQKKSDALAGQAPASNVPDPGQQNSSQLTAPSASTAIGTAPVKTSAGGAGNKAEQGQSTADFTKVGYNPKAYMEQNVGNQTDLNLSEGVVKGAKQATDQLKAKSAEFAAGQPAVQEYSDEDIQSAISGDSKKFEKIQAGLNPQPLTPAQKAPDFSSLKAPETLESPDALAAQLKRQATNSGQQYNQGMADFDRALYEKSDAYKADKERGQNSVQDFNNQLDAEIKKYAGTDIGDQLQHQKDQLAFRLKNEAANIEGGIDKRVADKSPAYNEVPNAARSAAEQKGQKLVDDKLKEARARLSFLNNLVKKGSEGREFGSNKYDATTRNDINREIRDAMETINGLQNFNVSELVKGGEDRSKMAPSFVTTQAEADKFAKIQQLLAGQNPDGRKALDVENPIESVPELDEQELSNRINELFNIGDNQYKYADKNVDDVAYDEQMDNFYQGLPSQKQGIPGSIAWMQRKAQRAEQARAIADAAADKAVGKDVANTTAYKVAKDSVTPGGSAVNSNAVKGTVKKASKAIKKKLKF